MGRARFQRSVERNLYSEYRGGVARRRHDFHRDFERIGTAQVLALSNLSMAIGNLVLSVMLVRWYGLIGVAIGTLIPMVVFPLFVVVRRRATGAVIAVDPVSRVFGQQRGRRSLWPGLFYWRDATATVH